MNETKMLELMTLEGDMTHKNWYMLSALNLNPLA